MTEGPERLLAAAGIGFATALALAGLLDDRSADAYLLGLAAFFLVAFLGALRGALRWIEGETAPLSATAVIGGSAAAAVYAVLAALYAGGNAVDPAPLAFGACFPQAAVLGAAGSVMYRTGVVSRRLGVAGQVLVPLQLAMPLVLLGDDGEVALAAALGPFALWAAVAGALLARAPAARGFRARVGP